MNFIDQINTVAMRFPHKSPPIPVGHPLIGRIGECVPGKGFRLWGISPKALEGLLKDKRRARRYCSEGLAGMLKRLVWDELGTITTWDGVLNARANGKANDFLGYKASQTTVAASWSSFFRSGGVPSAGAYTNIPGGAAHNRASAGAFPLINPTSPDKKYLLVPGGNHITGTNIVMLIDLLVAAGNINANLTGAQTVNTVALTRYTDGLGVMMILEVTTALGATASNITIAYTDESGNASTTAAIAMTTSCIVYRLQPVAGGAMIPLANGDFGVRSVQTVTFSAAMLAGVVAILLYKPLWLFPTLGATYWVEPSTPQMLSGFTELVTEAGGNVGCLTFVVLASTTSTGVQTYMLRTCMG